MNTRLPGLGALSLALLSGPALAHHSFSMFDRSKTVTLSGTVDSFDWVNPHAWLLVAVTAPDGQADVWQLEMGGTGGLQRRGWTPNTLKAGDKVTVRMHPLRDGSYGGQFVSVTLPNGRALED
jgi:hypothetical protein